MVIRSITSGDTAFRSARLILAETLRPDRKSVKKRLILTVPLLAAGVFLFYLIALLRRGRR